MIVKQIQRFLGNHFRLSVDNLHGGRGVKYIASSIYKNHFAFYLTLLFLISKLFYIANIIFQLILFNYILGDSFHLYGIKELSTLDTLSTFFGSSPDPGLDSYNVRTSMFPRVTMCDFKVRRLGNIHRYTVQCLLPVNLYIEKVYLFLWFWMISILIMSVFSFIIWMIRAIAKSDRISYITNLLISADMLTDEFDSINEGQLYPKTELKLSEFTCDYLKSDGCFILRLIHHNTDRPTACDIAAALWRKWLAEKEFQMTVLPHPRANGYHNGRKASAPPPGSVEPLLSASSDRLSAISSSPDDDSIESAEEIKERKQANGNVH